MAIMCDILLSRSELYWEKGENSAKPRTKIYYNKIPNEIGIYIGQSHIPSALENVHTRRDHNCDDMWTADVTPSSYCSRHRNWHRGENVIDLFAIKIIRLRSAGSKPANIFNKTKWFRITPLLSRFKFQTYEWRKKNVQQWNDDSSGHRVLYSRSIHLILSCELWIVKWAWSPVPSQSFHLLQLQNSYI